MNQTSSTEQSQIDRLPCNGQPLSSDEVRVPQFISPEDAELIGAKHIQTRYLCGIRYHFIYITVPAEAAEIARKVFNANLNDHINEQLGPNRYSRCLIRQQDGSTRPCPKEINGHYHPCTNCPNRNMLEKEQRNPVSLETLFEKDFHPMENAPSAEDCAMLDLLLNDLINTFVDSYPQFAEIIRLGYSGLSRKEIIQQLPMKKSQAYQTYNKCKKTVEELLKG